MFKEEIENSKLSESPIEIKNRSSDFLSGSLDFTDSLDFLTVMKSFGAYKLYRTNSKGLFSIYLSKNDKYMCKVQVEPIKLPHYKNKSLSAVQIKAAHCEKRGNFHKIINTLLDEYDAVVSDTKQTTQAKETWKKFPVHYKTVLAVRNNKFEPAKNIESFYSKWPDSLLVIMAERVKPVDIEEYTKRCTYMSEKDAEAYLFDEI